MASVAGVASQHRYPTTSGSGVVSVRRRGSISVVTRAFASSPLRLLNPHNHGCAAWLYSATYGGGLVDGDAVRLALDVGDAATAFLSTQASTKVYRSPSGTSVQLDATVGEDGLLVIAPDPVVCFAGARFSQVQAIDLAETGGAIVVDSLTSGRRARGERWAFEDYATRLTVRRGGRLLVYDSLALRCADGDLRDRMQRFDVVCLITIVGRKLREHVRDITARIAERPLERRAALVTGASLIGDDGCVVRLAGVSVEQVAGAVRNHLQFVPSLLGDDPWARKW